MSVKRILIYLIGIIIFLSSICGYIMYRIIFVDNVSDKNDKYEIFITPGESQENLFSTLDSLGIITTLSHLKLTSRLMSFSSSSIKSGKFIINSSDSNRDIINKLRSGNQNPVKLTINNVRTLDELSGKLSSNIYLDSIEILNYLNSDEVLEKTGFNRDELMTLFIPNTYQVYWNISLEDLIDRMINENKSFWNESRKEKAISIGLDQKEVYTLASIVDKESLKKSEKNRIAGLYMNRLNKNIALQADPTIVFALKNFELRRILNKHLDVESPFNTYKYSGLPPGPIGMASISGIDAVLDYEKHDFIYMCAKPDGQGKHAFAKTLAGHNRNARVYHDWLNSRGIR